jgi:hypothetical protein
MSVGPHLIHLVTAYFSLGLDHDPLLAIQHILTHSFQRHSLASDAENNQISGYCFLDAHSSCSLFSWFTLDLGSFKDDMLNACIGDVVVIVGFDGNRNQE